MSACSFGPRRQDAHRDPKPLVFASRERGQTLRVRPSCECVAKRFAKHIPGWVEAIRYARMDLSGWLETTSYARPPEATVAMLAMNAGRRLHLRVTLIAHGLLPRVMRSDPRPGCVSTAIVSARRDAEETGPSLTAGCRPRRSRGASGPAKPRSTPLRSWRLGTGSTRSARPVVAA